jgi:hypothetical protein
VSWETSASFSRKIGKTWTARALLGALVTAGFLVATAERAPRETQRSRGAAPVATQPIAPAPFSAVSSAEVTPRSADIARSVAPASNSRALRPDRAAHLGDRKPAAKYARLTDPRERQRLVNVAYRELEALELQEPKYFLTVFDMMREEERWDERTLEAGRRESHRYILARMNVLAGMLRRFVDDPESDHSLESDRLAEIDDEFKMKIEALSRDVPALANIQELLTSTILKAPAFTDQSPETE